MWSASSLLLLYYWMSSVSCLTPSFSLIPTFSNFVWQAEISEGSIEPSLIGSIIFLIVHIIIFVIGLSFSTVCNYVLTKTVYCGANFNLFWANLLKTYIVSGYYKRPQACYTDVYGIMQPFHWLNLSRHSISAYVKARRGLRKESSRLTPVCKVFSGWSVIQWRKT